MSLQIYECSKDMSLLKKSYEHKIYNKFSIYGALWQNVQNERGCTFPLNIIPYSFMTIHLIRFIHSNIMPDLQLDIKLNFPWEVLTESWGEISFYSCCFASSPEEKYFKSVAEQESPPLTQKRSWFKELLYKKLSCFSRNERRLFICILPVATFSLYFSLRYEKIILKI